MADTGILSGTSSSGTATLNADSWYQTSGIVVFVAAGQNCTVSGFSGTISDATIDGIIVHLEDTYDPFGPSPVAASGDVQISLDAGSSFSSAISTGTLGSDSSVDLQVGGSTNTWGLTWPSTLDLSNIRVKMTQVGDMIYSDRARIQIYYTPTKTLPARFIVKSSKTILKSGKLTIK